jgi:hypothetical protein
LYEGNFFSLNITNYGNAEVNKIELQLFVEASYFQELKGKKMLSDPGRECIIIEISEIIGRNGGMKQIPLISTSSFPKYDISVFGCYYDIRNKKYTFPEIRIKGENTHFKDCETVGK